MAVIVSKQSGVTSTILVSDNILKSGELAYSYVDGDSSGGDRLFIGAGGDASNGFATEIHTVGGKYYTDMMDHPKGSVKASSAIITDANNKIDLINIDNITIDGNTISSYTGNVTINPTTDIVDVSTSKISNVIDPTSAQDAATKNYIDTKEILYLNADNNISGTGAIVTGEPVIISGGSNINTTRVDLASGGRLTVNLDSDITGLSSLTVDNVAIDGNTISTTSGNLTLDPAAPGITGTVIIAGNLQVDGTTTTINSTTLEVDDKNITLASGAANPTAADSAGIHVDGAGADIYYRASDDKWVFNKNIDAPNLAISGGLTTSTLTGKYLGFDSDFAQKTTDDLTEGSNLYYTDARARASISVTDNGGDGSLTYDSITGEFIYLGPSSTEVRSHFSASGDLTYDSATGRFSIDVEQVYSKANFDSDLADANTDGLPEGSTNLYYTTTRADSDFDTRLVTKTTDDLTEGSNLYYTDTRFDTRLATKTTDNVAEGSTNLYFTGERVDDRVYQLLHAGEGIDLNYLDNTNELIISTELASTLNPGVATFDSQEFLVTAGNVEINIIDCGTY